MRDLIIHYFQKYKNVNVVFDIAEHDAVVNIKEHWFIFNGFVIFYKNDKTNEKKELSFYSEIDSIMNQHNYNL